MKILPFALSLSLPLAGWDRFSAEDLAALVVTSLLAALARRFRYRIAFGCLLGSYWIQIYLPIVTSGGWVAVLAPILGLGFVVSAVYERDSTWDWESLFRTFKGQPALFWAVAVPLGISAAVAALFSFSPLELPKAFVPRLGITVGLLGGSVWFLLSILVLTREDRFGRLHAILLFLVPAAVVCSILVGEVLPTLSRIRSAEGAKRMEVSDWIHATEKSEAIRVSVYDRFVRLKALGSAVVRNDPGIWIGIAKGGPQDISDDLDEVGEFRNLLAWGGALSLEEDSFSSSDPFVGLEIDFSDNVLWALTAKGRLIRIDDEGRKEFQVDPVQTDFVDCAIARAESGIYLLENCGRLARFVGGRVEAVSLGVCDPSREVFRRLKVDPSTGNPWAMDLYGVLYHTPIEAMWFMDFRFKEKSRRGDLDYDVARDFCIAPDGTIALLMCDGEVWTSSKESSEVHGPIRGTHYFPDYPVAQSIDWKASGGLGFVDRYGGFFHTPYPTHPADLKYRGTYLFPRGVFVDPDEVENGMGVIDHVFDEERRWLYQLTADGRLLTNFQGMGTEAD